MDLVDHYAEAAQAGARRGLPTGLPSICRNATLTKYPIAKYSDGSRLLGLPPPAASSPPHPNGIPYVLPRTALDVESVLAENAQLKEQLADSQSENEHLYEMLMDMWRREAAEAVARAQQAAGAACDGAAADVPASGSFDQGDSLQPEGDVDEECWQQQEQQQEQDACRTPTRSKSGSWKQQCGEQGQEAFATPSHAIFRLYNALDTLQYEQYLLDNPTPSNTSSTSQRLPTPCAAAGGTPTLVDTPTPRHTSTLQQLPSCPLVAAAPPACAPAASSLLWAEGAAGLAHACVSAAVFPEYRLFGAGAYRFGPTLVQPALLAAVPQVCAPTAAAGAAAGGTTTLASIFAEGCSLQLEEDPDAFWRQQQGQQQQAGCESPIRAGVGSWEQQRGEQGQQACAAPSHGTVSISYPFMTMMQQHHHQQQVDTPTPRHSSSTLQQLPSCPLEAAAPPACAAAASSGLWAEGAAGLADECASAEVPLLFWPFGAGSHRFGSALVQAARLAAVPQACAPTAAAGTAAGGTTTLASIFADVPPACAAAAASLPGWQPFGTGAAAGWDAPGAAAGNAPFAGFAEGYSLQLEEDPDASWQQQQQQQVGYEPPVCAGAGACWEQQRREQGQQACTEPSHNAFSISYPFMTMMMPEQEHQHNYNDNNQQQYQQQVDTPTPSNTSSTSQRLPSCPLLAAAPPACAPAASSGLWAEGAAGLAHAYASAAARPEHRLFVAGACRFGPTLVQPALLAAVPQVCAPTAAAAAAAAAAGGTTILTSIFAHVPPACAAAAAAAASSPGWQPFGTCAGGGAVGPHLVLAATEVARAAGPPTGVSLAPGACGSGSRCHVPHPAAHVSADTHRHATAARSRSQMARQPEQGAASFAVLRAPVRAPMRTPFNLRSRLPPMRFVCTPAGANGRGCRGGGGK